MMMFKLAALALAISATGAVAQEETIKVDGKDIEVVRMSCSSTPKAAQFDPCLLGSSFIGCSDPSDLCMKKNFRAAFCRPADRGTPSSWEDPRIILCGDGHAEDESHPASHAAAPETDGKEPGHEEEHSEAPDGTDEEDTEHDDSEDHDDSEEEDHEHDGAGTDEEDTEHDSEEHDASEEEDHEHDEAHDDDSKTDEKESEDADSDGDDGHDHEKDHDPDEGTNCLQSDLVDTVTGEEKCQCAGNLWRCADKVDPITKACDVGLKCIRKNAFYAICADPAGERAAEARVSCEWDMTDMPCGVNVAEYRKDKLLERGVCPR